MRLFYRNIRFWNIKHKFRHFLLKKDGKKLLIFFVLVAIVVGSVDPARSRISVPLFSVICCPGQGYSRSQCFLSMFSSPEDVQSLLPRLHRFESLFRQVKLRRRDLDVIFEVARTINPKLHFLSLPSQCFFFLFSFFFCCCCCSPRGVTKKKTLFSAL